jgi:ABC-type microcin C transport system duplicated ATPase subunit YejF
MTPAEPRERFNAIIAEVRLGTDLVERYPHGLSLGYGNASTFRPIAAHASLVVLDELTSAWTSRYVRSSSFFSRRFRNGWGSPANS